MLFNLLKYKNMSIEINAKELITPYRFDLMIKYLYGKSILKNYETSIFKEFYYDHIQKWNGFNEPDNKGKNSFDEFDKTFRNLISDFQNEEFDQSKGLIPIDNIHHKPSILNGAHRTVAAMLNNKSVYCKIGRRFDDGVFNASWLDRFSKHFLDSSMTDLAAIQYAKLKQTTHIAVLFSSSRQHHSEMINVLHTKYRGCVVYKKEIILSTKGQFNMMNEFYGDEKWIGTKEDNWSGLRYKARKCSSKLNIITVCLLDYENLDEVVKAKEDIRGICGIANHSVHISDYHDQAVELSGLFFNSNSLEWLNRTEMHDFTFFNRLLKLFKHEIKENNYDIDEYCITASSTLSAFGLREGDDLDYIKTHDAEQIHSHGYKINCHNKYGFETKIYPEHYDELIMNPQNYFWYKGVKFLSLNNLRYLKTTRGEDKDIKDLQLINSIYNKS